MKEYVYPKVPNYYHESVPDTVFAADDLVLIEKLDGSNCKVCVYDGRYSDLYGADIHEHDPSHGDVFISSKNKVRGRLSDPLDSIDGAFDRVFTSLRDRLDADTLLEIHDDYDSPIVLFGEHMVRHTIDYGYGENPPPAFIGFDVLVMDDYTGSPDNPFNERFDAFLDLEQAFNIFDAVGLDTTPVVDRAGENVDPADVDVPLSEYANVEAEGLIMRSDSMDRRVKHVTEQFRERAQESWGLHESDADSGVELFTARYLTNARIRKTVNKLLHRNDASDVTAVDVAHAAVADAWEEELADIRSIGITIVPANIYPDAETQSNAVIETMRTNAALNETSLDQLWQGFHTVDNTTPIVEFEVDTVAVSLFGEFLRTTSNIERELVRTQIPPSRIHETAEALARTDDRDLDRWTIEPVADELTDAFWHETLPVIANIDVPIVPNVVSDEMVSYVTTIIEARDDVTVNEKPDDWQQDIQAAETSGLADLF